MISTIPLHVNAWLEDMSSQINKLVTSDGINNTKDRKMLLSNHLILLDEIDNILNGEGYFIGAPRVRGK